MPRMLASARRGRSHVNIKSVNFTTCTPGGCGAKWFLFLSSCVCCAPLVRRPAAKGVIMALSAIDKILVVNAGSSSLKFMLFCMSSETMLAKGLVERIGKPSANLSYQRDREAKINLPVSADNHGQALTSACRILSDPEKGVIQSLQEVQAIGHRVVHGGEFFNTPSLVTDSVKQAITKCAALAPLHNPPNLGGIVACEQVFPGIPDFICHFHFLRADCCRGTVNALVLLRVRLFIRIDGGGNRHNGRNNPYEWYPKYRITFYRCPCNSWNMSVRRSNLLCHSPDRGLLEFGYWK
jgi:hypothetical protein